MELDSILAGAHIVDRIYEASLRETCLELLGREKKIEAEGGGPYEALGEQLGGFAAALFDKYVTGSKTAFIKREEVIQEQRRRSVAEVEAQEQRVRSASRDELHRSLESYLAERLHPWHRFVHVAYKFQTATPAMGQRSGEIIRGRLRIWKGPPSSSQPSSKGEDERQRSAASGS